jgi:hypothetical protein
LQEFLHTLWGGGVFSGLKELLNKYVSCTLNSIRKALKMMFLLNTP